MKIVRLEIFGFKSFVDRFVLSLDKNMVGIVGPNGCGKSNIVDALRWVLGETNARQLRGGVLEDLIFNGSDARRPLGMCEVSITLRNEGRRFEVVSPEDFLSAQGETPEPAGLPEGELEVGDVEVVAHGDGSVIELVDPGQSAAKSNTIPSTLADIPGLFDSTEVQLTRRLYRSGESEYFINRVPCRLSDMIEFYRIIGLGARGLSIVQQGQVGQIITKKPVERRELLEEAAGISGFRARVEVAQRKLEKTSQNMLRLQDVITEVEKQVRALKRQASRAEQRAELKEKLKSAELEVFQIKAAKLVLTAKDSQSRTSSISAEIEEHQNRLLTIDADCEKARGELYQIESEIVGLRQRRDEIGEKLNLEKAKENSLKVELSRIDAKISSCDERVSRISRRQQAIQEEVEQRTNSLSALRNQLDGKREEQSQAENRLAAILIQSSNQNDEQGPDAQARAQEIQQLTEKSDRLPQIGEELRVAESELINKRRAVKELNSALHNKQISFARLESEIAALNSQLEDMAEAVIKHTGVAGTEQDGKVFLAGLSVPEDIQQAVQAILGETANFLVHDQPDELARLFAEKWKDAANRKDRAKVGVIAGICPERSVIELSAEDKAVAPSARPVLNSIQVAEGFEGVAHLFLSNVLFVETLPEAIALQNSRRSRGVEPVVVVTKTGEVATHWGWYTTDGKGVALSYARRIREREGEAQSLEAEIEARQNEARDLETQISEQDQQLRALRAERDGAVEAQRRLNQLLNIMRQEERRAQETRLQEERQAQNEVRRITSEVTTLSGRIESEQRRIDDLGSERNVLAQELDEISGLKEALNREKGDVESGLAAFVSRLTSEEGAYSRLQSEYQALLKQIKEMDSKRDWLVGELSHVSSKADEARRSRDRLTHEQNELRISQERSELEVSMLHADIERFYPGDVQIPDAEGAAQYLSSLSGDLEAKTRAAQDEARQIRSRIEREGDVDPESIGLYETERVRLESMTQQFKDLEKAKSTLEDTIKKLKHVSRERFLETFAFVSKKFEELMPRLFGGGGGKLELINPDDPLASGVEITVRPPGKKLKSMELMSGGEKAMAATALLFAVFLFKPSPICVLDEVDAPLDDANLDRFLELVREISCDTQFLIITHNKQSMAATEKLVGITMQERGVSTALTVTFDQAEEELSRMAANS